MCNIHLPMTAIAFNPYYYVCWERLHLKVVIMAAMYCLTLKLKNAVYYFATFPWTSYRRLQSLCAPWLLQHCDFGVLTSRSITFCALPRAYLHRTEKPLASLINPPCFLSVLWIWLGHSACKCYRPMSVRPGMTPSSLCQKQWLYPALIGRNFG